VNGPEHYREAERLLKSAAQNFLRDGTPGSALAAAQVHATLALAAATAREATKGGSAHAMEWVRAFHGMDESSASESEATR
jgi:hypothetical protein